METSHPWAIDDLTCCAWSLVELPVDLEIESPGIPVENPNCLIVTLSRHTNESQWPQGQMLLLLVIVAVALTSTSPSGFGKYVICHCRPEKLRETCVGARGGYLDAEDGTKEWEPSIPADLRWEGARPGRNLPAFLVDFLKEKRQQLKLDNPSERSPKVQAAVGSLLAERQASSNLTLAEEIQKKRFHPLVALDEEQIKAYELEKEEKLKEKKREKTKDEETRRLWLEAANRKRTVEENLGQEHSQVERKQPLKYEKIAYKRRHLRTEDFDWKPEEDTTRYADMPGEIAEMPIHTVGMSEKDYRRQRAKQLRLRAEIMGQNISFKDAEVSESDTDKHWSEKAMGEMDEHDWRILKEDYRISYRGIWYGNPMRAWEETDLQTNLLSSIFEAGYERPTAIQMAAIPVGLTARDMIGVAATGSGKTAAFVIPLVTHILQFPRLNPITAQDGPYGLILAPTRELALQIEIEAERFAKPLGYRVLSVVGGLGMQEQGNMIRMGKEIVIATPGRAADMLAKRHLVLNQCSFVIIDEADRMVEMGFEEQLQTILAAIPKEREFEISVPGMTNTSMSISRKTYMFSATMPRKVEKLARGYMRNPVMVFIGEAGQINEDIHQEIIIIPDKQEARISKLEKVVKEHLDVDGRQVIVFSNTKDMCDVISRQMERWDIDVGTLHSGKSQGVRSMTINAFRANKFKVMVATDVLGRGIDIKDIGLVINFQMPATIQHYTHRVGRTGRAGKKGKATSFVTMSDKAIFSDLKRTLKISGSKIPYELDNVAMDDKGEMVYFE